MLTSKLQRVNSAKKNRKRQKTTKIKEMNTSNVSHRIKSSTKHTIRIEFKYSESIEWYTEAIFCKIPNETKAIYYCNRSLANLRMENTSIALNDACECIKLDASNVKGYYRKGQAYVALRQMKEAVNEFKTVCKMQPQNRDARDKYNVTLKAHKEQMLAAAIQYKDEKVEVDVRDIHVEDSYNGPRFEDTDEITPEWVESLIEW